MSASPPDIPSQLDAAPIHPEFGYLAPTMRFRRQLSLTVKGAVLGALAGAVAMFFMTTEREEEKALTMLATPVLIAPAVSKPSQAAMPTQVAATNIFAPVLFVPESIAMPAAAKPAQAATPTRTAAAGGFAPVRFVPETVALPAATPSDFGLRGSTSPTIAATAAGPVPSAQPSTVGASPVASEVATAPEPAAAPAAKAKPKKKIVREPQPERTARPVPPEPEPRAAFAGPPPRRFGLSIFGFGW